MISPYRPFNPPAPMFSLAWMEEIDLSGGAAAIAVAKDLMPRWLSGTDDIRVDQDLFIKRILWADETVGVPGEAILSADKPFLNTTTIWRQQRGTSAEWPVQTHEFPGRGFFIPAGTIISMTAASAGSGAESHAYILHCWSPAMKFQNVRFGDPGRGSMFFGPGLKTGTLVANTLTGRNDILGHTAAYEDSELSFRIDPQAEYVLYGLIPRPGLAAVICAGFEHPSGLFYMLYPMPITGDSPLWFPMDQPWAFNGAEKAAPKLVAAAGVTTSTEFKPLFTKVR